MEKAGAGVRINWDIEIDIYTLLCIEYMTNKNLLSSTGNPIQYSVMTYMGKESKKEWIYVSITDLLCCTEETNNIINKLYCNNN